MGGGGLGGEGLTMAGGGGDEVRGAKHVPKRMGRRKGEQSPEQQSEPTWQCAPVALHMAVGGDAVGTSAASKAAAVTLCSKNPAPGIQRMLLRRPSKLPHRFGPQSPGELQLGRLQRCLCHKAAR